MTWLDYAVIGVLAISTAWGVWRGLVREVMSLAGWVIAFLAANLFAGPLAEALPQSISQPELRVLVAFVVIFVVTLTITTIAALLLARILKAVGLGSLDRTLGGLFGVARGLIILLAFALLAGLTSFPLNPIWKESWSGPALGRSALALKPWLPPAFAERLRYH
jgi:membrane protein required for colicin V production